MLIVFLNYIVFLSAKIAIKTETFLIKILCFTIYHFIEWLMPGFCFIALCYQHSKSFSMSFILSLVKTGFLTPLRF